MGKLGWDDPDYARFLTKAKIVAKQEGYAIAVHGSTMSDLDVVAIPWIAKPRSPKEMVTRVCFHSELKMQDEEPTEREHGRLVWSLLFPGFGDPRFVDFSVIPPNPLQATFDLQWEAQMRAVKRWQATNPGKEATWPDQTNLLVWLMNQLEAKTKEGPGNPLPDPSSECYDKSRKKRN